MRSVTMRSRRHRHARIGLVGTLARCVAVAGACVAVPAVEQGPRFVDVYVGISSAPTPNVTEDSSGPLGTTSYTWKGERDSGIEANVTILTGRLSHARTWGFEYGVQGTTARYDTTPTRYEVDGTTFSNTSTKRVHDYTAGVNILAGIQAGIRDDDRLHAYCELLPFIGGGVNHAGTVLSVGGAEAVGSGNGLYGDYGVLAGAYLTERRWIAGITGSYRRGSGSAKIDFDSGYSTKLKLEQSGFTLGGVLGYRF